MTGYIILVVTFDSKELSCRVPFLSGQVFFR